ncbi:uncharacterized protein MELLADRAFT_75227 [Melampsora larici-populina 98AG31]|uniref:Uncharacterized protein n=1 Tax=Melampsora larici-populina (strain 98AG31 / pathotype 3-4-7) TaxID=747676 RepID=F4RU39_MELLP|nr:uncharacterized protein MELLADRAFT_75227 [Melampsora larici-populina 98AG31]EGG04109.1 hypothetical protein MELLADRAFT_75227 [Melampsora larici-populina 98AG31]
MPTHDSYHIQFAFKFTSTRSNYHDKPTKLKTIGPNPTTQPFESIHLPYPFESILILYSFVFLCIPFKTSSIPFLTSIVLGYLIEPSDSYSATRCSTIYLH